MLDKIFPKKSYIKNYRNAFIFCFMIYHIRVLDIRLDSKTYEEDKIYIYEVLVSEIL